MNGVFIFIHNMNLEAEINLSLSPINWIILESIAKSTANLIFKKWNTKLQMRSLLCISNSSSEKWKGDEGAAS